MFVSIGRNSRGPGDLIDLLLECHQRIRGFVRLAETLGRREDVTPVDLVEGCLRCERYFIEALPLHVRDEEDSLLPRLRGLDPGLDGALTVMSREHLQHEALIELLLAASRAVRELPGERARGLALAEIASRLGTEFERHLELEEQLIFPSIRELLSPAAQEEIIGELRRRRGTY